MNIEAIRKAAEAAKVVSRASNKYDAYLDAVMTAFANPEKGLELCRLAEIGQEFLRIQAVLKEHVRQTNREDLHQ